jgi:hypothetical protein
MIFLTCMKMTFVRKWWIFFAILVLIFMVAAVLQPKAVSLEQTNTFSIASEQLPASREANAEIMLETSQFAIYVENQPVETSSITIGYAIFASPGFIVIREDNGGIPGNIIGVSNIEQGRIEKKRIDLQTSLIADRVYYAELVMDDGDAVFDERKDKTVNTTGNSVVLMSFLAKN